MMNSIQFNAALFFSLSTIICYCILWLFILTPLSKYFKDPPGQRKIHQRIVPRAGGICVIITFLIGLYGWHMFAPVSMPHLSYTFFNAVVFATVTILGVGLLDDSYAIEIQNKAKFLLEIIIALEIVFILGIRLEVVNIFGFHVSLGYLSIPVTVFWLVGVANAMNIIDGIDGLAGSIALTSMLALGVMAWIIGAAQLVIFTTVLAGSTMGFLLHNRPPARVFLGDTGSLFLGMMTGLLTIKIISPPVNSLEDPVIIVLLVIALPILDVSVAMIRRYVKSITQGNGPIKAIKAMTVADNDHIHHRLVHRGLSHGKATCILTAFNAILCAGAVVALRSGAGGTVVLTVYATAIILWFLYRLDFFSAVKPGFIFNFGRTPAGKRAIIGVIQADDILHHALANYEQNDFVFQFLRREQAGSSATGFAAFMVVNASQVNALEDRELSHQLVSMHKKPVILISDCADLPVNDTKENGQHAGGQSDDTPTLISHATRPVYVPALLNELYRLIRRKADSQSIGHRLGNFTRPHPSMNGTANVKKI